MKQDQYSTLALTGTKTTPADICRWAQALFQLHARIAPRFARPEPRRRALLYLQGILSDVARKNSWQLAEHAGEEHPNGMQRLLSQAVWDTDGVRDEPLAPTRLSSWAPSLPSWSSMRPVFPNVARNPPGSAGSIAERLERRENCQVGVFLSYVTARGHALIDRELYLPLDWCEDADRRSAAHIPESVRFQTKPELAAQMIERISKAALPLSWVVADTVYGGNFDLRTWLETRHYHYVLAVACNEPVAFQTPQGRRREEAALLETFLPDQIEWHRLPMSEGTKGPRLFDWAIVPMLHRWQDDGCHFLLIRRSLADPQEKRYYFVFAPLGTPLCEMVAALGCRWRIEEDFENAKDSGLDHYEVRSFIGWYRYITLVLLALADFPGICATEHCSTSPPAVPCAFPPRLTVLPLTVPEVRHLLARLIWPSPSSAYQVLGWSWWRRDHQRRASYFHTKRRLKTG